MSYTEMILIDKNQIDAVLNNEENTKIFLDKYHAESSAKERLMRTKKFRRLKQINKELDARKNMITSDLSRIKDLDEGEKEIIFNQRFETLCKKEIDEKVTFIIELIEDIERSWEVVLCILFSEYQIGDCHKGYDWKKIKFYYISTELTRDTNYLMSFLQENEIDYMTL